jgi:hypothetical protein
MTSKFLSNAKEKKAARQRKKQGPQIFEQRRGEKSVTSKFLGSATEKKVSCRRQEHRFREKSDFFYLYSFIHSFCTRPWICRAGKNAQASGFGAMAGFRSTRRNLTFRNSREHRL